MAWRDDAEVRLGEPQQRAVLGFLACSPNVLIQRESIVDAVWGHRPPRTAVKLVQSYVSRLRRIMEPRHLPRRDGGLLPSRGTCYQLRVSDDQVDLLVFDQLIARAATAESADDLAAACAAYEQALGLWRGDPLVDVIALRDHSAVTELAHARASVILRYAAAACGLGWYGRVLPQLRVLARREPLNESAHAHLMIALAGSGEQAAALEVYEQMRSRLDEQLGILPSAELAAAHLRVLRQDFPSRPS
jgi:DNA-binding SARP family transcriptional activator